MNPASRVALLVYPGFSEFEVTVALTLLAHKYEVVTVGLDAQPVRGEGGLRVLPDRTLSDADSDEFAAMLIPGAADMEPLAHHTDSGKFINEVMNFPAERMGKRYGFCNVEQQRVQFPMVRN